MKITQMENVKKFYGVGDADFEFYGTGVDVISVATPEAPISLVWVYIPNENGQKFSEKFGTAIWDYPEIKYNVSISGMHKAGESDTGEINTAYLNFERKNHMVNIRPLQNGKTFYLDSIIIYNKK